MPSPKLSHAYMQAGYRSAAKTIGRDAAEQAEKLACCGVGAGAHGGHWAPGLLGTDTFIHMGAVGLDIAGVVHTDMHLVQISPAALSHAMIVTCTTETVDAVPRGEIARMCFDFAPAMGDAVICKIGLLVIDPDKTGTGGAARNWPQDPRDGFAKINERQITPDDVVTYGGAGNPIHDDPAFAQSVGYRAPIAHGVMTAAWMLAGLDRDAAPRSLDATFSFRRPVFWDDAMELWHRGDTYRTVNAEGKMTAEMRVQSST